MKYFIGNNKLTSPNVLFCGRNINEYVVHGFHTEFVYIFNIFFCVRQKQLGEKVWNKTSLKKKIFQAVILKKSFTRVHCRQTKNQSQ